MRSIILLSIQYTIVDLQRDMCLLKYNYESCITLKEIFTIALSHTNCINKHQQRTDL